MRAWIAYTNGELIGDADPDTALAHYREAIVGSRGRSPAVFAEGVALASACALQARAGDVPAALSQFAEVIDHWVSPGRPHASAHDVAQPRGTPPARRRRRRQAAELLGALERDDSTYGEKQNDSSRCGSGRVRNSVTTSSRRDRRPGDRETSSGRRHGRSPCSATSEHANGPDGRRSRDREHALQRDLGPLGGVVVDDDLVHDRRRATSVLEHPREVRARRCGTSSSTGRSAGRATRSSCPGAARRVVAPCGSRCRSPSPFRARRPAPTSWMRSVEPTLSAISTTSCAHSGCTTISMPGCSARAASTCAGLNRWCTEQWPFHSRKVASLTSRSSSPPSSWRGSQTRMSRLVVTHRVAGVAAEVLVREEEHLVAACEGPLEHRARVRRRAHGAAVAADERLQRGRRVHVRDRARRGRSR